MAFFDQKILSPHINDPTNNVSRMPNSVYDIGCYGKITLPTRKKI
jgi:hypothetical protein